MKKNTLKEKLNAGKPTLGPFVGFPSPSIVETMGWDQFDLVGHFFRLFSNRIHRFQSEITHQKQGKDAERQNERE